MEIDGDINEWYYKQILNGQHNKSYFIYTRLSRRLVEEDLALAISPLKTRSLLKLLLQHISTKQKQGTNSIVLLIWFYI